MSRFIPILTLDRRRRVVKTLKFGERTYIGDPFNIIRLFNEKEVDEIVVLDIDATVDGRRADVGFLRELASECFMPLAYGGGISEVSECERISRVGIEKVVIGTAARNVRLVADASRELGSQAVVGVVDYVGRGLGARCVVQSGRVSLDMTPVSLATELQSAGAGEILLQSIDRDGIREGMDLDQIRRVSAAVSVPLVALGGAQGPDSLWQALESGASAAASGSAFCFVGRLRAVLVTYPTDRDRRSSSAGGTL